MMRVWAAMVLVALWLFLADFTPKSLLGLTLVPLAFFMCCCDNGEDTPCCVGHNLPPTANLALTVTIESNGDPLNTPTWRCVQGDLTLFHFGNTSGSTRGPGIVYLNSPILFECDSFGPDGCSIVPGGTPGVFIAVGSDIGDGFSITNLGLPVSCDPPHFILEASVTYDYVGGFQFPIITNEGFCILPNNCMVPNPAQSQFGPPVKFKVTVRCEITG